MAGAGRQLDHGQAAPLDLVAQRREGPLGHRDGLEPEVRPEVQRRDEAVEALTVWRTDVHRDAHAARNDVRGARFHEDLPHRPDGAVDQRE